MTPRKMAGWSRSSARTGDTLDDFRETKQKYVSLKRRIFFLTLWSCWWPACQRLTCLVCWLLKIYKSSLTGGGSGGHFVFRKSAKCAPVILLTTEALPVYWLVTISSGRLLCIIQCVSGRIWIVVFYYKNVWRLSWQDELGFSFGHAFITCFELHFLFSS